MPLIASNPIIDTASLQQPSLFYLNSGAPVFACLGSPEGVIRANIYAIAVDETGVIYVKTTDYVNTGWVAVGAGGGTVTGTGTPNQMAYWDGVSSIGSGAGVEYENTATELLATTALANTQAAIVIRPFSDSYTNEGVFQVRPATSGVSLFFETGQNFGAASLNIVSDASFATSSMGLFAGSAVNGLSYITMGANSSPQVDWTLRGSGGASTTLLNQALSTALTTRASATGGIYIVSQANAPIVFGTGGSALTNDRLRILGSGLIGINKSVPTTQLDIVSNAVGVIGLQVVSANGATVPIISATHTNNVTNTLATHTRLISNSNGSVSDGFGSRILTQLESSTTDAQDASGLNTFWITANHAFRVSGFTLSLVPSGGALTEFYRWTPDTFSLHEGTVPNVWTSGVYIAKIYAIDDVLNPTIQSAYFSNSGGVSGVLSVLRGRGTNASPQAIQSGDRIGALEFWGQHNTSTNNFSVGPLIRANATQNWSAGVNGSNLEFYYGATGGGSTLGIVLTQTGTLRINPNGAYSGFTTNNLLQVGNYASWNNDTIAAIYSQNSGIKCLELIGISTQSADMFRIYLDGVTPDLVTVTGQGIIKNRAGTSNSQATIGGTININTTDVGNVGAGEDNLITYTLPANALATNNDYIEIIAWGRFANNGNNKTVKLYFGAEVMVDTGAVAVVDLSWYVRAVVVRTGATAQKYNAQFIDTQGLMLQLNSDTATETLSGTVVIKCTGEATSNDDIIQNGLIVKYYPTS